MKRLIHFAFLFVFAGVALAAEVSPDITPQSVLEQMNAERAALSLPPLRYDERLEKAALDRMRDMEEGGWWSHQSPDGRSPFVWLAVRAYDFEYAGENLATGFETPGLLVEAWMESPGHRANILSAHYEECGIAIIEGSTVRPAAGKSIVVLFARRFASPTLKARAER
jgi:uncharacterized protein YkwD